MKKSLVIIWVIFCFAVNLSAGSDKYLCKINGVTYSVKQFETWWKYGKNRNSKFPLTLTPFVSWILLSDEAKNLDLESEPSFQKKIKIFKEVRSLLQLRYDEVEKKIKTDNATLFKFYEKEFSPLLKIKALVTNNKSEAELWKKIIKNSGDFEKFFKKIKNKNKARAFNWKPPISIPEPLKNVILKMRKNDVEGPVIYKGNYYFIFLEDKKKGSKKDFDKNLLLVKDKYKKYMDIYLTDNLIKRLRKKYKVRINNSVIEKINPYDNLTDKLKTATVLEIKDRKLTGEQFYQYLKREIDLRFRGKKISDKSLSKLKKGVINNSIAQTLTSIEGLNRHYERNVMKDVFWFYKRNRFIKELESKIIAPTVKVTEKDVENYYHNNKKHFTMPATVEIAVIQTKNKKLIDLALKKIRNGENFFEVARDVQFHGAQPKIMQLNSLVKEMRAAIKNMKPGHNSNIIKHNDWFFIVKLIKKNRVKVVPFDKVKGKIEKFLNESGVKKATAEYVKKLRKMYNVEINMKAWNEIVKQHTKSMKITANSGGRNG